MILTEETHNGVNECTMETSRAANEEPVFGQVGANNEVVQTRFVISGIPGQTTGGGWHSNITSSVSKLGSLTKKAGPNVLLKVMAGDQLNATAKYYYQNPVTNGTGNNLTSSIVTALIQSILGSPATGLAKGNTAPISTQLNADPFFVSKTAPDASNASGTNPKAYMTIVFFDERFNYVAENSMAVRVSQQGDNAPLLVLPLNTKAPKNGFAYIYLSNESAEPVYFDDFTVSDTRGRIIEEDHYYAYGLKIAGISSKKLGDINEGLLDNKNLYNDKELIDDADLDWYDYGYRNYDPQIGRFTQLDPLTDNYPSLTPYQYASNDPINNIDIDGLEGGLATVGSQTGVVTAQSFMKTITVSIAKNVVPKISISALTIGVNAYKIGKTVADHTQNLNTIRNANVPLKNGPSLLDKVNAWFRSLNGTGTKPGGPGSHQPVGIVFDGNDGTTDNYTDRADIIVDNIHMGSFMELLSTYKPSGVEGSITNETVEKTVSTVDELSKTGEQIYKATHEEKPKWSKPQEGYSNQTGIFVNDSSVNEDGSKTYFQRIQKLKHPVKVPTTFRTKVN